MERIGKFQVLEKIGEGGFGIIYLGLDPHIQRRVAIKTCTSDEQEVRDRFFNEARIAGNLHHRNVVTVYDFGLQGEVPYLVQEYLSGEDLDRKIKRHEYIPFPEKLHYLIQIARGLEYAHSQGVIHRDVKPANIRILEDGTVKIMDFGIAKLANQETGLTRTGMTLGTASYLAPEQIRGEPVDPRTDIFSFGTLAYELVSYQRPFRGEHISTVLYQILNETPPALQEVTSECSAELAAIVSCCLQREPVQRYPSCAELLEDLKRYLAKRRALHDSSIGPLASDLAGIEGQRTRAMAAPRPGVLRGTAAVPEAAAKPPPGLEDFELTSSGERALSPTAGRMPRDVERRAGAGGWWAGGLAVTVMAAVAAWFLLGPPADRDHSAMVPASVASDVAPASLEEPVGEITELLEQLSGAFPTPAPEEAEVESTLPEEVAVVPAVEEVEEQAPPPPPPTGVVVPRAWSPAVTVRVGENQYRLDRDVRIELDPGRHTLQFALVEAGYRDFESLAVTVGEGEERRVAIPILPPGQLQVQPRIGTPGGEVYLGEELLGTVPPIVERRLRPGTYTLEVRRADADAEPLSLEVDVAPGRRTVATFDLAARTWTVPPPRPLN